MSIVLRAGTPADAAVCGPICFRAFKSINDTHNFPPDFPTANCSAGASRTGCVWCTRWRWWPSASTTSRRAPICRRCCIDAERHNQLTAETAGHRRTHHDQSARSRVCREV